MENVEAPLGQRPVGNRAFDQRCGTLAPAALIADHDAVGTGVFGPFDLVDPDGADTGSVSFDVPHDLVIGFLEALQLLPLFLKSRLLPGRVKETHNLGVVEPAHEEAEIRVFRRGERNARSTASCSGSYWISEHLNSLSGFAATRNGPGSTAN